jgi:hypothetical protein
MRSSRRPPLATGTNRGGPGLGGDLASELDRAFEMILHNPKTWPLWPATPPTLGIRRFLLAQFPFAVAFIGRTRS